VKILPIISFLQGYSPALSYIDIGGAADLAAALDSHARPPAAFVLPYSERRTGGRSATHIQQRVASQFSVISLVKDVSDRKGKAAVDAVDAVSAPLKLALATFVHPDADGPALPVSGDLRAVNAGLIVWEDRFEFHGAWTAPAT
jgi:hypothetical protein